MHCILLGWKTLCWNTLKLTNRLLETCYLWQPKDSRVVLLLCLRSDVSILCLQIHVTHASSCGSWLLVLAHSLFPSCLKINLFFMKQKFYIGHQKPTSTFLVVRFIIFRCSLVPYVCANMELDIHQQQTKPSGIEWGFQGAASSRCWVFRLRYKEQLFYNADHNIALNFPSEMLRCFPLS